jgi:hypothetical protein
VSAHKHDSMQTALNTHTSTLMLVAHFPIEPLLIGLGALVLEVCVVELEGNEIVFVEKWEVLGLVSGVGIWEEVAG